VLPVELVRVQEEVHKIVTKYATKRKSKAFTLVELMIICVIVAILATIALVVYNGLPEKARSADAYAGLSTIVSAENAYLVEHESYADQANIGSLDIDIPVSSNFDFVISSNDTDSGYASAKGKGNATKSYGMCLKTAKKISCTSLGADCNPSCP